MLQITPWERAALQLLADGTATSALADRFRTSEADLEARLTRLFVKMGVAGRSEAVAMASRRGLVTLTTPELKLSSRSLRPLLPGPGDHLPPPTRAAASGSG